MSLKEKTQALFANAFGYPATHTIQAPGRVNLIGEHTDYNDGFVLPCAIDYQTVISCAPRDDRKVRVMAADYENQLDEFSLDAPIVAHENYQWANYVLPPHWKSQSEPYCSSFIICRWTAHKSRLTVRKQKTSL